MQPDIEIIEGKDGKHAVVWQVSPDSDNAASIIVSGFSTASHIAIQQGGDVIILERSTIEALPKLIKQLSR